MESLLSFLFGVLGNVIAHDFCAWAPKISLSLIETAAARLSEADRERYREEWLAHLHEQSGVFSKLRHALGCFRCARKMQLAQESVGLRIVFVVESTPVPVQFSLAPQNLAWKILASVSRVPLLKQTIGFAFQGYVVVKIWRTARASGASTRAIVQYVYKLAERAGTITSVKLYLRDTEIDLKAMIDTVRKAFPDIFSQKKAKTIDGY